MNSRRSGGTEIVRLNKAVRNREVCTPAHVRGVVDDALFRPDRHFANLTHWLEIIEALVASRRILEAWKRAGRPPTIEFAPYIAYLAKVRYFFLTAVVRGVMTTRPSNAIDMEYFYYLPFARIFSSNDNLRAGIYPALAQDRQIFMPFADLKAALRETANYYDAMTPEQKRQGAMTYADYPPIEMITLSRDRTTYSDPIGELRPICRHRPAILRPTHAFGAPEIN